MIDFQYVINYYNLDFLTFKNHKYGIVITNLNNGIEFKLIDKNDLHYLIKNNLKYNLLYALRHLLDISLDHEQFHINNQYCL